MSRSVEDSLQEFVISKIVTARSTRMERCRGTRCIEGIDLPNLQCSRRLRATVA